MLDPAGEAVMHERRLDWAVNLAEPALWVGADQRIWLERLEAEHANCRAALRWAITNGRSEGGLQLAAAIHRFWDARGYRQERWNWLEALPAVDQPAGRLCGQKP